jgi:hypothetical protein
MAGADDHGNTFAAWAAVVVIIVAFIVGGIAIVLGNWTMFWVSVGVVVVGGIIGKLGGMARGGVSPR